MPRKRNSDKAAIWRSPRPVPLSNPSWPSQSRWCQAELGPCSVKDRCEQPSRLLANSRAMRRMELVRPRLVVSLAATAVLICAEQHLDSGNEARGVQPDLAARSLSTFRRPCSVANKSWPLEVKVAGLTKEQLQGAPTFAVSEFPAWVTVPTRHAFTTTTRRLPIGAYENLPGLIQQITALLLF
jgi:hypothetical protein